MESTNVPIFIVIMIINVVIGIIEDVRQDLAFVRMVTMKTQVIIIVGITIMDMD